MAKQQRRLRHQQHGQRLSRAIILTFITILVVKTTHSAIINHGQHYQPYSRPNDQYEVIDVSHQNNSPNPQQPQTGRTTRIVTNGEVNDDFWLKHLGDDFRQAIHLQVGGAGQYTGLYNQTDQALPVELQNEYQASGDVPLLNNYNYPAIATQQPIIPINPLNSKVDVIQQNNTSTPATTETVLDDHKTNKTQNTQNTQEDKKKSEIIQNNIDSNTILNNTSNTNTNKDTDTNQIQKNEQVLEAIYRIDNSPKYDSPNSLSTYDERHHTKNYSPKLQYNIKRENSPQEYNNKNSIPKPIVVDLPDTNGEVQQEDEEKPVLVKLPPVIYHNKPTAYGRPDIVDDNEDSSYSQSSKHPHTQYQKTQQTQYPQAPYSPYTAEVYNPPSYDAESAYTPNSDAIFSENTRNMSPGGVRYIQEEKTPSSQYASSIPNDSSYSSGGNRRDNVNKNLYYEGL